MISRRDAFLFAVLDLNGIGFGGELGTGVGYTLQHGMEFSGVHFIFRHYHLIPQKAGQQRAEGHGKSSGLGSTFITGQEPHTHIMATPLS